MLLRTEGDKDGRGSEREVMLQRCDTDSITRVITEGGEDGERVERKHAQ